MGGLSKKNAFPQINFSPAYTNYTLLYLNSNERHNYSGIMASQIWKQDFLELLLSNTPNGNYCNTLEDGEIKLWHARNGSSQAIDKLRIIKDVPEYFSLNTNPSVHLKTARTYPGFVINLSGYNNIDDYLQKRLSNSSRYNLRTYKRRLEACFHARYTTYCGDMSKEEYEHLFREMVGMIKRRFREKEVENRELGRMEEYRMRLYTLIRDKRAVCHVIYSEENPISISFNLLADNICFGLITSFDTDYTKFHPGFINIIQLVEWCIDNKIVRFDMLKGDLSYKRLFADQVYSYHNILLYPARGFGHNWAAVLIVLRMKTYYLLLGLGKKYKLHHYYRGFQKFRFRWMKKKGSDLDKLSYRITNTNAGSCEDVDNRIDLDDPEYSYLRRAVFSYIYNSKDRYGEIQLFKSQKSREYTIKGKERTVHLAFES